MNDRVLVNGMADARIAPDDRGLCYGDGLFETVLFVQGRAPLWQRHMARMADGCSRLQLPMPDEQLLAREASAMTSGLPRASVRVTLTRGSGPRGYAMREGTSATRIVAASAAAPVPADWYDYGIRMRLCSMRLARQPRLAGIKHLNRLEQVLARAEWNDAEIVEGLLCDAHGLAICATAANLFVVRDRRLYTPALEHCGVAGVARAEVLAQFDCEVRDVTMAELTSADEVFLTNAVRGVIPVTALDDRSWNVGTFTRTLIARWRERGLIEDAP